MSESMKILLFFVSCVLTNNLLFSKYVGENVAFEDHGGVRTSVVLGAMVLLVMSITGVLTGALQHYLLLPLEMGYLVFSGFALIVAAVSWLVSRMFIARGLIPSKGLVPILVVLNSAVLGAMLFGAQEGYSFLYFMLNGVFGGIGFFVSILIMTFVRERLLLSDVPDCMKGLPISLVSAGLIALAFLGFAGFAGALVL